MLDHSSVPHTSSPILRMYSTEYFYQNGQLSLNASVDGIRTQKEIVVLYSGNYSNVGADSLNGSLKYGEIIIILHALLLLASILRRFFFLENSTSTQTVSWSTLLFVISIFLLLFTAVSFEWCCYLLSFYKICLQMKGYRHGPYLHGLLAGSGPDYIILIWYVIDILLYGLSLYILVNGKNILTFWNTFRIVESLGILRSAVTVCTCLLFMQPGNLLRRHHDLFPVWQLWAVVSGPQSAVLNDAYISTIIQIFTFIVLAALGIFQTAATTWRLQAMWGDTHLNCSD